jgi:hypothetical protein
MRSFSMYRLGLVAIFVGSGDKELKLCVLNVEIQIESGRGRRCGGTVGSKVSGSWCEAAMPKMI